MELAVTASAPQTFVHPGQDLDGFCREHVGYVWRCLRHIGVPEADLPDATQDVLIAATQNLHKYEGRSSVKTWLYGFAKNVSMSYGRASYRERRKRDAFGRASLSVTAPDPMSARDDELHAIAELNALLDELDEEKRQIYILAAIEEVPIVDIAKELGVNVNTLYTRLHSARNQLRACVKRRLRGERNP